MQKIGDSDGWGVLRSVASCRVCADVRAELLLYDALEYVLKADPTFTILFIPGSQGGYKEVGGCVLGG